MATTYAFPAVPSVHGHAGHAHSHSRKFAIQRMPLQPTSTNGTFQSSSEPAKSSPLKPQDPQPDKPADMFHETHQHQQSPAHLLPSPHPSFSTPTNARSKSMERRKSVGLPTHLRLQSNGYGFPPVNNKKSLDESTSKSDSTWTTARQVVNSLLIPLPCVLASMAFDMGPVPRTYATKQKPLAFVASVSEDGHANGPQVFRNPSDWMSICAMTSMALLLVGLRGKLSHGSGALDRRKRKPSLAPVNGSESRAWGHVARRISGRVLAVGLPFYATSKLGGTRVASIVLFALATNIINENNDVTEYMTGGSWRSLIGVRIWTLLAIVVQVACDCLGLTNHLKTSDVLLGYTALALAIFVFPPPLPSSRPKASIITSPAPTSEASTTTALTTPWEAPPSLENQRPSIFKISPMICTSEDADLTIWSGATLGVFCLFASMMSSSAGVMSHTSIAWSILTACTAALAVIYSDPAMLLSSGGLGFGFGSFASCVLLTGLHSDPWIFTVFQSILIFLCFAAMKLDTHTASTVSSAHSAHHHHHHHHAVPYSQSSRFTSFVLDKVRPWPLLHSIIAEKDSRRIFYFMW